MKRNAALQLLAVIGVISSGTLYAQESAKLNEVQVIAKEEAKTTGEIKKTARAIRDELIADTKDLVRYTTDVGIADSGRHNKGFAMRGVEGNRVGINIDGVSLPDSEENSLYARYGNFNSSRIQIDPELVTGIDIMRGADSFNQGSGSLGGGVTYRTMTADDIVQVGNKFGVLLRSGYASKNDEWTNTISAAYKDEKWDALGLYSYRYGHELKSTGKGADIDGAARGVPDPNTHKHHNYLAKLGYLFNDKHRVSATYSGQAHDSQTDERSYELISLWRYVEDYTERNNLNLAYEYFPMESKLGYLKAEYDYMKTVTGALNYKGTPANEITNSPRTLVNLDDRQMRTDFQRISLRLDSVPLESGFGTHQLSLKTSYGQKDFENHNQDLYFQQGQYSVYTIQHPIRSRELAVTLQDSVTWSEKWRSDLGLRYNHTQFKPQGLNANCRNCSNIPLQTTTFRSVSGNAGLSYQINDTWKAAYNYSTGYRVPSASEMYFTFENAAGNWIANPQLKPEESRNHTFSIQANHDNGDFILSLYRTNYRNFLYEREQLAWKASTETNLLGNTRVVYNGTTVQQAINIDRAKVEGIDISGKLNVGRLVSSLPEGLNIMGAIGYSKGKFYGRDESMLPIQPVKAILGIGYDDPQDHWGVQSRWTYLGAKKGKDAQILRRYYDQNGGTRDYPYLNGSAVLFDVFGFAKVGKNVTLRAGAYNIFNRKYQTWDALRGITQNSSTTNTVDREGKGLARFYAPGRNFAASVEVKF